MPFLKAAVAHKFGIASADVTVVSTHFTYAARDQSGSIGALFPRCLI